MVPPGDNLEFKASDAFRDRSDHIPAILHEVKAALRNNPSLGSIIAGTFKEMDLKVAGDRYVVFLRRKRNVVVFVAIFDASDEATIEAKKAELKYKLEKGEIK